MYRIDENTYIDDSLVTCAEYQLFIDEMRAQAKFFLPDHWTSYQFPTGQARAPILGVRPSDAVAFCEWLSRREAGEWRFRLPAGDEAAQYPIRKYNERFNGFWTLDRNGHHFYWIGTTPVDPRGIDFSSIFALDFDCARARVRDSDLASALDCVRTRDLARDLALARALTRDLALDLALDLARDLDRDRDLALARALALDRTLDLDLDFDLTLDLARNRALDRDRDLDRALDLALTCALVLACDLDLDLDLDRDHVLVRALAPVLSIWIDLVTLQERIAGRSPAFEGIRLTKERKLTEKA